MKTKRKEDNTSVPKLGLNLNIEKDRLKVNANVKDNQLIRSKPIHLQFKVIKDLNLTLVLAVNQRSPL